MAFDPFGDFESRGYLRNVFSEKDPAIIKDLESTSFRNHLPEALKKLNRVETLSYSTLIETHRMLFPDLYPWAGVDRSVNAADIDISRAGVKGMFALPSEIRLAGDYAFQEANTQLPNRAGHILGLLAYAHPFLECNGRAIFLVHHEMLARVKRHLVWDEIPREPFLSALRDELLNPNATYMDDFLKPYVRQGTLSLESAESIFTITFGGGRS